MNHRDVTFTETARRQVLRERTWWSENREYKEVFAEELAAAIRLISLLPGAGSPYDGIPGLKRVYLERLAAHV